MRPEFKQFSSEEQTSHEAWMLLPTYDVILDTPQRAFDAGHSWTVLLQSPVSEHS